MKSNYTWRRFAAPPLFCLAVMLAACGRSEWRELEVSEGAFSVLMRGEPHYVRQALETPAGKMIAHLYSSDRPDAYYAVGYADYPLALVVGTPPEQLFNSVRDTWVRRINGKLSSSDGTLKLAGKYPGVEFMAEGTSTRDNKAAGPDADAKAGSRDTYVQARLYLVDQRLYQLVATGRKNEVPQGVVNRFLNSFKLIAQSETGTIKIEPGK
jgi:hypothetical protein